MINSMSFAMLPGRDGFMFCDLIDHFVAHRAILEHGPGNALPGFADGSFHVVRLPLILHPPILNQISIPQYFLS